MPTSPFPLPRPFGDKLPPKYPSYAGRSLPEVAAAEGEARALLELKRAGDAAAAALLDAVEVLVKENRIDPLAEDALQRCQCLVYLGSAACALAGYAALAGGGPLAPFLAVAGAVIEVYGHDALTARAEQSAALLFALVAAYL